MAQAWPRLGWTFLSSFPSRTPELAGVLPALAGSAILMGLTAWLVGLLMFDVFGAGYLWAFFGCLMHLGR